MKIILPTPPPSTRRRQRPPAPSASVAHGQLPRLKQIHSLSPRFPLRRSRSFLLNLNMLSRLLSSTLPTQNSGQQAFSRSLDAAGNSRFSTSVDTRSTCRSELHSAEPPISLGYGARAGQDAQASSPPVPPQSSLAR